MNDRKKFGKQMFKESYIRKVGQKAIEPLHNNSLELLDIINEQNILVDGCNVFEIGSGGNRNLYYMHEHNKNINLFANDLWKKAVLDHTHESIKDKVKMFEGSAEEVLANLELEEHINLFVSSDVLMHIEYDKAKIILELIRDKFKPEYIIIRERKKEFDNSNDMRAEYPKLYHNYNKVLGSKYELITDRDSKTNPKQVFVRLFKRIETVEETPIVQVFENPKEVEIETKLFIDNERKDIIEAMAIPKEFISQEDEKIEIAKNIDISNEEIKKVVDDPKEVVTPPKKKRGRKKKVKENK